MVATTLKRPVAIRSISSSICCSDDDGELRSAYVLGGEAGAGVAVGVADVEAEAASTGGRSENKEGDGAMKDSYWSRTWVGA